MLQVLISTMYLENPIALLEKMNIQSKAVIINQCDKNAEEHISFRGYQIDIYSVVERGLSKSRNMAIRKATSEILVFADDDFKYEDNYAELIEAEYIKNNDAQMMIFGAIRNDGYVYRKFSNGILERKNRFSINSIRITVKRSVILEKGVSYDERFGTGADISNGEDTIFVTDCFNKKMKVYNCQDIICRGFDDGRPSTWWHGYDEKFFVDRGVTFKRLSKNYIALILYFAIKNYKNYKNHFSFIKAILLMIKGAKKYKKLVAEKNA